MDRVRCKFATVVVLKGRGRSMTTCMREELSSSTYVASFGRIDNPGLAWLG